MFFNFNKPGRGVSKDEKPKKGLALFFDVLYHKFGKLVVLNINYILFSLIPFVFIYFVNATIVGNLFNSVLIIEEGQYTALSLLCVLLSLFFMAVIGTGPASASFSYALRNFIRGEHVWIWSDSKDKRRENFRQATILFIIDLVMTVALSIMFYTYFLWNKDSGILNSIGRVATILISYLFVSSHLYIYPMMVTFELKLKDLIKNSIFMSFAKLGKTFLATVTTLFFGGGILYLMLFTLSSQYGILLPFIIPVIYFSFIGLIKTAFAYPTIKELMLDKKDDDEENEEGEENEEAEF